MLAQVKKLVADFEKLQQKYEDVGAGDTEPSAVFHFLLRKAFQGIEINCQNIDWGLYTEEKGAKKASREMSELFAEIYALISDMGKVQAFLKEYAWRVDW